MPPQQQVVDVEARLRDACTELRRRWRSGRVAVVEDLLTDFQDIAAGDSLIELIYTEVALREELGQPLPREDWLVRFPRFRDRLNRLLDLHDAMGGESISIMSAGLDTEPNHKCREFESARIIAGYELLEEIGRGGMGVVYKARHQELNRLAAVKLIRDPELSGVHERSRLLQEARAAAQLQHPNIVQVYEVGERDGRPFLAMELVNGQSLAERLRHGPLPAMDTAGLVEQVARAIEFAHQHDVVHRDLKPANILVADGTTLSDASVKIVDFGLAKRLDSIEGTKTTGIVGTPSYMAPEQIGGETTGPATDIWSMGVLLYECLTGRPPFQGPTALEVFDQVRSQDPVLPSRLVRRLPRS